VKGKMKRNITIKYYYCPIVKNELENFVNKRIGFEMMSNGIKKKLN